MHKPLYEVEGKPVFAGDALHCPPHLFFRAGETVWAYLPDDGSGEAVMRSLNGAVPTVKISDLSWREHPETIAMRDIESAGFDRPSVRDVEVWMAAQRAAAQKGE